MFGEILRNFSGISRKMSLKTVIPQKSLILGINSGEFLENFRGTSYRKWLSRNSLEIFQKSHHIWRIWGNSSLLIPEEHLSVENNFLKNYLIFSGSILWQPVMHFFYFTFRSSFQCKLHKKQEIVTDMFRDHTVLLWFAAYNLWILNIELLFRLKGIEQIHTEW